MLNAEIIAIGSEMLTPFRLDTNSLWLTERLNSMGVEVKLKTVVGDDEARLEETVRDAMKRSEIVISTGGLGPTEDDITRKIFARVLKRQLILEDAILEKLRARFARRNMPMPEINARQALVIHGAQILENDNGTAPGMLITEGKCTVVLLPGPPREMKPIFDASVAPVLKQRAGDKLIVRRTLSIFGLAESAVDELAAPIYTKYQNPSTTILFKDGQIELHLTAQARNESETVKMLDDLAGRLDEVLGEYIFSRSNETLEAGGRPIAQDARLHAGDGRKLHRRIARRADHGRAGQFGIFPRRRRQLFERSENRSARRAEEIDSNSRRRE